MFTSLAEMGNYLLSVKKIEINPAKDQPSSYNFVASLELERDGEIIDTVEQIGFVRFETISGKIEYFSLSTSGFYVLQIID